MLSIPLMIENEEWDAAFLSTLSFGADFGPAKQ